MLVEINQASQGAGVLGEKKIRLCLLQFLGEEFKGYFQNSSALHTVCESGQMNAVGGLQVSEGRERVPLPGE